MLDLTKDNFEAEVLQADGTVFVDYYGDGCIPCAEDVYKRQIKR